MFDITKLSANETSTVELVGGTQVHVDCLLPDSLARSAVPQPGAPVRLGIEPHNVFVFAGRVAA